MFDELSIPLEAMEKLEEKYNVSLHVDQISGQGSKFYVIESNGDLSYLGSTIKQAKKKLKERFGK